MYDYKYLKQFIQSLFSGVGCDEESALMVAKILLAAELRGIPSHGVIRIKDYYHHCKIGRINTRPHIKIIHESPGTAVVDGDNGLGVVPAVFSMNLAIEKAKNCGTGWVATKNSNHYGIAGYYAMMALEHDMIGLALTNANPTAAPTFSVDRLLGTNPIAVAIPALEQPPFVADMATTTVARGKLTVAQKKGEKIPVGWAQDKEGNPTDDPAIIEKGGAMLPLGGDRLHGGHKGYCLGAVVDILSAVLSGANFGPWVPPSVAFLPVLDETVGEGTGHFFGAIRIDGFMKADEFKARMDHWIQTMRNSKTVKGQTRVLIPGDPERENEESIMKSGISIIPAVAKDLKSIADEAGVEFEIR
jgi:L-2-hydroxycarboxylate dehydrogenase (NAD+)